MPCFGVVRFYLLRILYNFLRFALADNTKYAVWKLLIFRFNFREGRHKDAAVIWMDFKYDRAKIDLVKSLKGRWSRSEKCWYVPDSTHFRTLFGMETPPVGKGVLSKLSPVNARELQSMKEVLQMKAYSPSTIKTYMVEFAQLLYILKDVPVDSLGYDRLRAYILYCINTLKISESQLHSMLV